MDEFRAAAGRPVQETYMATRLAAFWLPPCKAPVQRSGMEVAASLAGVQAGASSISSDLACRRTGRGGGRRCWKGDGAWVDGRNPWPSERGKRRVGGTAAGRRGGERCDARVGVRWSVGAGNGRD